MINKIDIHADDYGYSLNTSKDILECVKNKSLDSFSIISNTSYFKESMEMLYKEIPNLDVLPLMCVHINLVEGFSDSNVLPTGWAKLFLASYGLNRRSIKDELKKEIKKQIETVQIVVDKCISIANKNKIKVNQRGIRLDSHMHTHLIPVVWDALTEVIEENNYDVEYIRNPKEPLGPFLSSFSLYKTYNIVNLIKNRILMFYSNKVDKYCDNNNQEKMYMCGLMMSGHMDFDRIKVVYPKLVNKADCKDRNLEILFHPGLTLPREYAKEMSKSNFENFNSSSDRTVEKNSVNKIKEL